MSADDSQGYPMMPFLYLVILQTKGSTVYEFMKEKPDMIITPNDGADSY